MEGGDEESLAPGISDYSWLQEEHACLRASYQALRRETRELKAQISQKKQKLSDFQSQINNHLEGVAHQKQVLSTRVEGLEMEQRQLQALDVQHKQEERSLRPRIDEAVAEHAATEARIQVLMDRLVILLSSASAASMDTMMSEILEEFHGSLLSIDEKKQSGKFRLIAARRENHDFAIRLSGEQSETKRLHDKLCTLQGDLYHGRLRKEAGDAHGERSCRTLWTEEDSRNSIGLPSPDFTSGGIGRRETQAPPVVPSKATAPNLSSKTTERTPSLSADKSSGERRAQEVMEAYLKEALDRISFQAAVVRIRPGVYTFGEDEGYLRLAPDGTVVARSLDGLDEVPLEDFLGDLTLKQGREFEQRHGRQMAENTSAQDDAKLNRLASAADDAAGCGGKQRTQLEEEKIRRLAGWIEDECRQATQKQVVATAGDDAAGRVRQPAEVAPPPARRIAGHNGDEAAGCSRQMEIRNATSNVGPDCVGGVSPLEAISSVPRLPEQLSEEATTEKAPNHLMSGGSGGSSSSRAPAENSSIATSSSNRGITTTQVSAPSSATATTKAPILPASPRPGNRSLGSIRSIGGVLSPSRLASPRNAGISGNVSPSRIPLGSKTGSSSPSRWTPQVAQSRAQPPPALTPRNAVQPQRAVVVPVSAPPLIAASTAQNSRRALRSKSPPQHVQHLPTGGVITTPRGIASQGGVVVGEAHGSSVTVSIGGKRLSAGGSLELPVGGMNNRPQSTSPSRRFQSPQPSLRTGTPGRLASRTSPVAVPILAKSVRR